jgi:hypothetical protein
MVHSEIVFAVDCDAGAGAACPIGATVITKRVPNFKYTWSSFRTATLKFAGLRAAALPSGERVLQASLPWPAPGFPAIGIMFGSGALAGGVPAQHAAIPAAATLYRTGALTNEAPPDTMP